MTVRECISQYKHDRKVKNLWVCPNIVREPKIGEIYSFSGSIDSRLSNELLDCEVKKDWIEEGAACIVYLPKDNPIIFT